MIGRVAQAVRETPWYGWLMILVAFCVGLSLTLVLLHASKQANDNCEAINNGRQTIRAILTIAQQNSPDPNNEVWAEFYERIKPINCGTE